MGFKAGTQQIQESIEKLYPEARVLRMDGDTTKKKDSYETILSQFADGEGDVLVGTQMIVKGHDFPNVTLVGVLAADISLGANDYRASERTFSLLTQAVGRAGRGAKYGEAVIQTYQPDNYRIVHAAHQDYVGFYEEEIVYPQMLRYPPVSHMMAMLVSARDEVAGAKYIETLAQEGEGIKKEWNVITIGPTQATISKINDIYRFVFYMKCAEREILSKIKYLLEIRRKEIGSKNEGVQFDFDPMNIY